MQPHLHPPMTPRQRVFLAVTVLMVLTVIGLVIGCDSDDTPTVTAPSGGGSGTPTRNMTAEQQGRDGLEETENGTMIRNKGEVALNVRFNYDDPRHYRLNAGTAMPSNPANADSAPTRVACGVPATGRANGQCFDNDGVAAPEPYSSNGGGGGSGGEELLRTTRIYADASLKNADECFHLVEGTQSPVVWTGQPFVTPGMRVPVWGMSKRGSCAHAVKPGIGEGGKPHEGGGFYGWDTMYTCGDESRVAVSTNDLEWHSPDDRPQGVSYPPLPFAAYVVVPRPERRSIFIVTSSDVPPVQIPKAICKPENFAACRGVSPYSEEVADNIDRRRHAHVVYTGPTGSDYTCLVTEYHVEVTRGIQ